MPEYTTAAIAVKCGKSERQVQRWVQSGKLKARRIEGTNKYEVSDEALVPFLPREATDDLLDRLEALEMKLEALQSQNPEILLEHLEAATRSELDSISARLNEMADKMIERIDLLDTRIKASESLSATLYERVLELERKMQEKPATQRPARAEYKSSQQRQGYLPNYLVPLKDFRHGIPESTAKRVAHQEGMLIKGSWTVGRHIITLALDAEGQRRFYDYFHGWPGWVNCPDCPHT